MSPVSDQLHAAILAAAPERLKIVLLDLCNNSEEAATMASNLLLTGSMKRKRYETCENCDKEFDVNHNGQKDCQFHLGTKEVDYDTDNSAWEDYEEARFGPREEHEEDIPEGFLWTCCNKRGDGDGCTIKEHIAPSAKRGKRFAN
ncbi:MAG: hypothetical protein M1821_005602 [Bathelium mastoideum]|nr:MAG: hypothetical protein M1821_005602 [Bathelium mastoideum]KAI9685619.1 MAG: hypothetical protein M1822_004477 [Bathelium mastoideum]